MSLFAAANRVLAALLLVSMFTATATSQLEPREDSAPRLPLPSGSYGIGRMAFDWTDMGRTADNAAGPASPIQQSELMVYLWYPTRANPEKIRGVLFPGIKEIDSAPDTIPGFKSGPIFGNNWTLVLSGEITSHVQENAPIAKTPKRFPVVIFSPTAFGTCFEYTSAIEDLVSHGYVVAAVEHTYETFAVAFPGGQVRTLPVKAIQQRYLAPPGASEEESYDKLNGWNRHRVDVRAADLSFVLDKLTQLDEESKHSSPFAGRLDTAHVAAVGHSRGGWAAVLACRRDDRFRACANLDGGNDGEGLQYPGAPTPKQPILYVELSKTLQLPKDWWPLKKLHLTAAEWIQRWHKTVGEEFGSFPSGGYFVEITADDMEHYSFSDRILLQAAKEGSEEKKNAALRGLHLTEDVTRTFLDQNLKGEKQPILPRKLWNDC